MRHFTKKVFVLSLAAVLAILPVASVYAADADMKDTAKVSEDEPSAGAMAADLVLARPLGIASTALGCAVFIASLPFSLPGGNAKKVFKKTVAEPAAFTFVRPLGEFD